MDTEQLHQTDAELVALDEVFPYVNNPKEHPDGQIDAIASSIKTYGFDQPIVASDDGEIIKGHGRLRAAEQLELERVPVVWRDDLTDAEAKAARIADNKTNLDSGWDVETLGVELEALDESEEFALEATGFDEREADAIIETADTDIDEFFDAEAPDGEDDGAPEDPDPSDEGPTAVCPECGHEFPGPLPEDEE